MQLPFKNLWKNLLLRTTDIKNEQNKLLQIIESLNLSKGQMILDVGAGYGRNVKLLRDKTDADILGIEVNKEIVKCNKASGLNCISLDEFEAVEGQFDVILMSHIIEHFSPKDLLYFLDNYLDCLKVGGVLIILTPLHSCYFYDDFDHIRPYQPAGIQMVFGKKTPQVQYYSRNKLELLDIWFRKAPFRLKYFSGLYLHKYKYKFWDKGKSLERISKHLGLYEKDNLQKAVRMFFMRSDDEGAPQIEDSPEVVEGEFREIDNKKPVALLE